MNWSEACTDECQSLMKWWNSYWIIRNSTHVEKQRGNSIELWTRAGTKPDSHYTIIAPNRFHNRCYREIYRKMCLKKCAIGQIYLQLCFLCVLSLFWQINFGTLKLRVWNRDERVRWRMIFFIYFFLSAESWKMLDFG